MLLVIVLAMFIVFASLDSGQVSVARAVAMVGVFSAATLILFGILVAISRVKHRDGEDGTEASSRALS